MIKLCINICFTKVSVCVATMVGQCPNTCLYLDVTNITYIRKYTYFVGIVYKYSVCLLCRPLPTICCKCSGDSTLLLILIHSSYAMNSQLYFLLFSFLCKSINYLFTKILSHLYNGEIFIISSRIHVITMQNTLSSYK